MACSTCIASQSVKLLAHSTASQINKVPVSSVNCANPRQSEIRCRPLVAAPPSKASWGLTREKGNESESWRCHAKGKDAFEGWMDLTSLVSGSSGAGLPREVEELVNKIGKEVYADIAGWHLYLGDMKMAVPLAGKVIERLRNNSYDERDVEDILAKMEVKLGGGKKKVTLLDVIPSYPLEDLKRAVKEFADRYK